MKTEERNRRRPDGTGGTWNTENRTHRHEKGDAPVIAVVLLVAVTVILAAVVGTFGLGLVSENPQTASAGVTVDNGEVKLINTGNVDEVRVEVDGFELGSMTRAGDSVPIAVPGEVTVNVIGVVDGDETLLRSKVVEDAGEAGVTLTLVNEGEGWDGDGTIEAEEEEVWDVTIAVAERPDFSLVYCVDEDMENIQDGDRCTEESLEELDPPLDSMEIQNGAFNSDPDYDIANIDTFELRDENGNTIDIVTASDTFVDDGRTTVSLKPE